MLFYYIATRCVKYNICSAWFLDVRISTCSFSYFSWSLQAVLHDLKAHINIAILTLDHLKMTQTLHPVYFHIFMRITANSQLLRQDRRSLGHSLCWQEKHENEKYLIIMTKCVMTDLLHSEQGIQVVHVSLSKLTLIYMIMIMVKENSLGMHRFCRQSYWNNRKIKAKTKFWHNRSKFKQNILN